MNLQVRVLPSLLTTALVLVCGCTGAFANDLKPVIDPPAESEGVNWSNLLVQSVTFLGIEHGFRWATEDGTRHSHRPFFGGYVDSLNNLHGWADGDPFYVNYVGHPMQGSVSGFLFVRNDRKYQTVEFGKNRAYWKSRLRATAFAWAYSEQFEIGPFSEASIGHTQSFFPQSGFVDQVATPTIGLGWMIAEDSIDRYIIKRIESHVRNPFAKILIRGGLNPSRSMANIVSGEVPWHRDTRLDIWETQPRPALRPAAERPPQAIAPLEFVASTRSEAYFGKSARGACIGGGGAAAFRITPHWQLMGDVSGCKLTSFGENLSGDSLTYLIGPRWTPAPTGRWAPYAQILAGGRTLTHELMNPLKKSQLEAAAAQSGKPLSFPDHDLYTRPSEITGFTVSAHAGVDLKLTSAIALRAADAGYTHSWHSTLDGVDYSDSVQFTSGLIVRFGTW
jgi:hypothetical protein